MLPIGGLLIAIAAGWLVLPEDSLSGFRHMVNVGATLGAIWQFLIRFVTPVMVTLVLLWQIGVFDTWLKAVPPPAAETRELGDRGRSGVAAELRTGRAGAAVLIRLLATFSARAALLS